MNEQSNLKCYLSAGLRSFTHKLHFLVRGNVSSWVFFFTVCRDTGNTDLMSLIGGLSIFTIRGSISNSEVSAGIS